jgi:hypothetical protein
MSSAADLADVPTVSTASDAFLDSCESPLDSPAKVKVT